MFMDSMVDFFNEVKRLGQGVVSYIVNVEDDEVYVETEVLDSDGVLRVRVIENNFGTVKEANNFVFDGLLASNYFGTIGVEVVDDDICSGNSVSVVFYNLVDDRVLH